MNILYLYLEQIKKILESITPIMHRGVAFEWKGENVFHLFVDYPKLPPTGYPNPAYVVRMDANQINNNGDWEKCIDDLQLSDSKERALYVFIGVENNKILVKAFVKDNSLVEEMEVKYVPSKSDLYSRNSGLLELSLLEQKTVTIVGLGSFGSYIAVELAKAGVGNFQLFDFDRIELPNIARHISGIQDLGRFKTHAIRDAIWSKNPFALVKTYEININENIEFFKDEILKSDLIICVTDENRSRSNINQISLDLKKTTIFGRAITRAEGGDVFRLRGGKKGLPCLACLIGKGLFNYLQDEISNKKQASRDTPDYTSEEEINVVVQVGLSSDIAPICNMVVKLALVELSIGKECGISSLEEDLVAEYYMWANRREKNYKNWSKMEFVATKPTILKWYGVRVNKDPECMVCNS